MSKDYALDIFETLNAIDRKDGGYLARQPETAQNAFVARTVLRWASCHPNFSEHYILALNEFANLHMDTLAQHPELVFRTMAMSGAGRINGRHYYLKPAKRGVSTAAPVVYEFLSQFYPLASDRELDLVLSEFTPETFAQLLQDAACDARETKEIMNGFFKSRGIEPPKEKKTKGKKGGS